MGCRRFEFLNNVFYTSRSMIVANQTPRSFLSQCAGTTECDVQRTPPKLIILAILALTVVWVVGLCYNPDLAIPLSGAIFPSITVFLALMKQDRDHVETVRRLDENDRKTENTTHTVVNASKLLESTVLKSNAQVAKVVLAADRDKTEKLDRMGEKLDTVVHQTNGALEKKLEEIKQTVVHTIAETVPNMTPLPENSKGASTPAPSNTSR